MALLACFSSESLMQRAEMERQCNVPELSNLINISDLLLTPSTRIVVQLHPQNGQR